MLLLFFEKPQNQKSDLVWKKKIKKTIFQLYLTVSIQLKYSSGVDTWSKLVVQSYIALNEDRWV